MNSPKNIWSELPLSAGIATLVCYAGVFNDVIGIEELAVKLAVSDRDKFYAEIAELHRRGRLTLDGGFLALPDLESHLAVKATKIATARGLINSRLEHLKKLGRHRFIKFIGVSGSLAAGNPTKDRNNEVDIDVFVITRNQCLWLYNVWRALKENVWLSFKRIFPSRKDEPRLCLNYIMDESDLLIANRNFYTATEIRNLIPVSGADTYSRFLRVNSWVDYYYPGTSRGAVPVSVSTHRINKFFYLMYSVLRDIKWCLKEHPLTKLSSHRGVNFNVMASHCGGYQAMVQKKFSHLAEKWFPELLDAALIAQLFPDQLSQDIRSGKLDVAAIAGPLGMGYDYGKYG